jgi:hypothetical protein
MLRSSVSPAPPQVAIASGRRRVDSKTIAFCVPYSTGCSAGPDTPFRLGSVWRSHLPTWRRRLPPSPAWKRTFARGYVFAPQSCCRCVLVGGGRSPTAQSAGGTWHLFLCTFALFPGNGLWLTFNFPPVPPIQLQSLEKTLVLGVRPPLPGLRDCVLFSCSRRLMRNSTPPSKPTLPQRVAGTAVHSPGPAPGPGTGRLRRWKVKHQAMCTLTSRPCASVCRLLARSVAIPGVGPELTVPWSESMFPADQGCEPVVWKGLVLESIPVTFSAAHWRPRLCTVHLCIACLCVVSLSSGQLCKCLAKSGYPEL